MKTQTITKTAAVGQIGSGRTSAPSPEPATHTISSSAVSRAQVRTASRLAAEEIATRAYKIWQQQGCPAGCEEQHWRQAEQEFYHDDSHTSTP